MKPLNMSVTFVTIATFHNSYELDLIQARLKAEGIPFFVQDERTLQTASVYAAAMGGARLQVRPQDVEKVTRMLIEAGVLKLSDGVDHWGLLAPVERWTARIPGLQRLAPSTRIFLFLSGSGILLFVILLLAMSLANPA